MSFSRQSALNDRHRALGSDLSTAWNDMPIPQNYSTNPYDETEAVRNRAGLFDEASKVESDLRVVGPIVRGGWRDGLRLAEIIDLHDPRHDGPAS